MNSSKYKADPWSLVGGREPFLYPFFHVDRFIRKMNSLLPIFTALLFCLISIPGYTAPSPSSTLTSLQWTDISLSSPNIIFNYRVPSLTISLEFEPLPGRPSRSITLNGWNSLVKNARSGAIARSHSQGGPRATVHVPFDINSFGINLTIEPRLSQGGFTYSEMGEIIYSLRTVGRSINYHEFLCKIFRTNQSGLRVNQIGTMVVEETSPSSGQIGELGAIEDPLRDNFTSF